MPTQNPHIHVNSEMMTPDPLGALFWAAQETLIVSDLHFEKGSSFAGRGVLLPPYDTRTTLMRLGALIRRYRPRRVISLGDAFHDVEAEKRMAREDADLLEEFTSATEWHWVLGNHDSTPPARFRARTEQEVRIGGIVFRHEPQAGAPEGEIAGHLHPCAKVAHEGRTLRRRCFIGDGRCLIMPAIGAYTGGLNVLDIAFEPLFQGFTVWVMGEEAIYPVAAELLAPDNVNRWKARASNG